MLKHFQADLDNVHRDMLSLSAIVEKMFNEAVSALCDRRYELVSQVIDQDETVDATEVRIEEECLKMLALHQPVAGDLRRMVTLIKINADLERIADLACNIAERAQSLQQFPFFPSPDVIPNMAKDAMEMVRITLDAFVNLDSQAANQVIQMDDAVDTMNEQAIEQLRNLIREDPSLFEPAMHSFSAVRHIERIADHAENIAEDVIYLIDGDIVRHKHGQFSSK